LKAEGPTPEAERHLVAKMHNLVGPLLDEFRSAGTAAVPDKHFGQDPFLVDCTPVQHPKPRAEEAKPAGAPTIDEHIVAEVVGPRLEQARPAAPEAPAHPLLAGIGDDPEKLKKALKLLVEGGLLAKSEAKRVWATRGAKSEKSEKGE